MAPLAVMRWMGWSWRELCETPAAVVEDVILWMKKAALVAGGR